MAKIGQSAVLLKACIIKNKDLALITNDGGTCSRPSTSCTNHLKNNFRIFPIQNL